MIETQLNVVLLGAPGSGKGTQAERIAAGYALPHISSGEMLRAAVAAGSELGLAVRKGMEAGTLVPDEVVIAAIGERLAQSDARKGFVLDGFPRTLAQGKRLDAMLAVGGRAVTHAILIDVPEGELFQRVTGRRMCRGCGKRYNVVFGPPQKDGICDVCGAELYQRSDDNEATMRKRLDVYRAQTVPLVAHYRGRGVLGTAHAGGELPDGVFAQVEQLLEVD